MLRKLMKMYASLIEAVVTISFITHPVPREQVRKMAASRRLFIQIYLFFAFPILLIKAFMKESDEREAIFILETLQQALSYSEWRHFDQIWEKIKDDLPPSLWNKTKKKQKEQILLFLIFLADLKMADIRLENKEEFLRRHFPPEKAKPDDPLQQSMTELYENLEKEATYYEALSCGVEPVFLRKPIGTRRKDKKGFLWALVPAQAPLQAAQ